ncbi:DUF1592 domain-containing protein [Candidatus Laterigemmans baculatus]|uniref:DUF1592 domain-containing protein n=1 Tax=Candidatus Laterigemmans baculatus TaxID=2770505 RepID=UPI0013DD04C0|nr:DUF1592 domain-containing protein [Candidatus Laterigemmans baculatus]
MSMPGFDRDLNPPLRAAADDSAPNATETAGATESADEAKTAEGVVAAGEAADWQQVGLPLVREFCLDCHNADYQEAELDLEPFETAASLVEDRGHWEKVLQRVQFGAMPPDDAAQPTKAERAQLIAAIEAALYGNDCDLDPKPSRVTIRRMNRAEYNNTIRDLFGQDLRPAEAFPSDEVGAGFDNNSDVLSLPPMLFERYMTAAEEVAAAVILDPDEIERVDIERSGETLHVLGEERIGSFYKHYLFQDSFAWAEFKVPVAGRYRVRVAAAAPQPKRSPVTLRVYDEAGQPLKTLEYKHADGGASHSHSFETTFTAGTHRLLLAKVEQPDEEESGDEKAEPKKAKPGQAGEAEEAEAVFADASKLDEKVIAAARAREAESLQVSRNIDHDQVQFSVKSISLSGPIGTPEQLIPEGHKRIVQKHPSKKTSVAEAARPGMEWLLRRAFRGPVEASTVEAYLNLIEQAHEREKSFERAMRVGVASVLVSPRFLFRVEAPPHDAAPGDVVPLTDHQLATRLSYFLWSSTPDEALLELADQGRLRDEAVLRQEVERMLSDPKADSLADNFASQWLGIRNLQTAEPDPERFQEFNDELREAMRQETRLLFLDLMRSDRSILDLLDADETFLNEPLAQHYGIEGVEGSHFRRVSLADSPRRGILTHASVLTLTSNPTRTSPVKRGKWILENVLGTPPPDPPPGVPELEETASVDADASLREQLEIHRSDPTCASCHRTMDPLGLGFENFGVTGGYREVDGRHPIDASGELPGGAKFDGAIELIRILREQNGEQFARTATERLLTFALGRELRFEDRCIVDEIVKKTGAENHRFASLATEVVLSPAFRSYTLEGTKP